MSSKEVSTTSDEHNNSKISDDIWIVPGVGHLPAAEYRKLRRLLHDLGRRNIYMRFKYVARLYYSGMLEKLVDFLNETGKKRKRSEDENEKDKLPEAKRKAGDNDAQTPESKENDEDDSALTDLDSNDGDSSDEAEDEDEEEEEEKNEKNGMKFTEGLFRSLYRARHHVSTQTDAAMNLN